MLLIARTGMISELQVMIIYPLDSHIIEPTRTSEPENNDVSATAGTLKGDFRVVSTKKAPAVVQFCFLTVL